MKLETSLKHSTGTKDHRENCRTKLISTFRALKHRNYRFFFSQIISLSGIGSILFGSQLQSFKHEAKRLIIALQMTSGVPASKASFQDITKA